jgi:hypothetical protein
MPAQHPSVVLRSHYRLVRGLLAIAMAAVLALTAGVVILANDEDELNAATKATPQVLPQAQQQALPAGTRFDGGPDEGTRGPIAAPPAPGTRFDGGPDEGTRGPAEIQYKERAGGPTFIHEGR